MEEWPGREARTARRALSKVGNYHLRQLQLEVPRDIAELVLGRVQKGVEGNYDRGPYFRKKSEALQLLADFVERITEPPADNVIRLRPQPTLEATSNVDGVAETTEAAHD